MSKKIHFVVTAYGTQTVQNFCRFCLGSLWLPENQKNLKMGLKPIFEVFTRESDLPQLQSDPVFQNMQARGWIQLSLIDGDPSFDTHIRNWEAVASRVGQKEGNYVFKLAPDVIFSEGSMRTVIKALQKSPAAVYASWHLRVTPEVADRVMHASTCQDLPANWIVGQALSDCHPLLQAYFRDSNTFPVHPENIIYPTKFGCIARVLACTPMIHDPARCFLGWHQQVTNALGDKDIVWLDNSEEFLCLSVLKKDQYRDWYDTPAGFDPLEISCWWKQFHAPQALEVAEHPFFFFSEPPGRLSAGDQKTLKRGARDVKQLKKLRDNFWGFKQDEKIERLIQAANKYESSEFYDEICS
jgi:hypothetical protein